MKNNFTSLVKSSLFVLFFWSYASLQAQDSLQINLVSLQNLVGEGGSSTMEQLQDHVDKQMSPLEEPAIDYSDPRLDQEVESLQKAFKDGDLGDAIREGVEQVEERVQNAGRNPSSLKKIMAPLPWEAPLPRAQFSY